MNSIVISHRIRFYIITAFELYNFFHENYTIFCTEEVISNSLGALTCKNKKSKILPLSPGEMFIHITLYQTAYLRQVVRLKTWNDILTKHIAIINNSGDDRIIWSLPDLEPNSSTPKWMFWKSSFP
jgi:hypothetical protein